MASNLDYLDPALLPLEGKVTAYLEAEKQLQRATAALSSETASQSAATPAAIDLTQDITRRRAQLGQLEQEIIGMLPTCDEWLKVNLGYGPSRVGAWHVPAQSGVPERYELRVVL